MKSHKPLPKKMIIRSQGYAGPPVNRQKFAQVSLPRPVTSTMYDQTCGVVQRGKINDADADPRADAAIDRAEVNTNGS